MTHSAAATLLGNFLSFHAEKEQLKVGMVILLYKLPYRKFGGGQLTGSSPGFGA